MIILNDWVIFDWKDKKYILETYYISEYWIKFWWSFMKKIGEALQHADPINTKKLLETFEDKIEIENIVMSSDWSFRFKEVPF